jgi:molybdate transport system substrate-binding protein
MAMLKSPFPQSLAMAFCLVLAMGSAQGCGKDDSKNELRVAAASSLAGAFESVGAEFTKESGVKVSLVLSSSGNLAQQIKEGAPYDIFASADLAYLNQLEEESVLDAVDRTIYAKGQVVMWVKDGEAPKALGDLTDPRYEHISIANPEYAPYGTAARDALQKAEVWDAIKGRVVRGSNVRQAMQFVESGNAEVGLIALSLALHGGGSYTAIDTDQHKPLEQGIAVVTASKKKAHARAFIKFLTSDKGAALLKPYGLQAAK